MAPLLALTDMSHVHAATLTAANAAAPFLTQLPLEVRVIIYEFAVAEDQTTKDQSIHPIQVGPRSNKFKWVTKERTCINNQWSPEETQVPFVSRLAASCRQIYFELETSPVFYRVNKFAFVESFELLKFLAALTPQRRAFIRNIDFDTGSINQQWYMEVPVFNRRAMLKHMRSVVVLLAQCKDLRQFNIQLHIGDEYHRSQQGNVEHNTRLALEAITKTTAPRNATDSSGNIAGAGGNFTIWDLPSIRPTLVNKPLFLALSGIVIDLTDEHGTSMPNVIETWATKSHIKLLIDTARRNIKLLREASTKARDSNTQDLSQQCQLIEALRESEIDFPGEERVEQDRFCATSGSVSTRTRRQCGKEVVNSLGVVEKAKNENKYTTDGLLIGVLFTIYGVRWKDSVIECDVMNHDIGSQHNKRSWEPVDAVMTTRGNTQLQDYYFLLANSVSWQNPITRLREIGDLPTPRDVLKCVQGQLRDQHADNRTRYKCELTRWRFCHSKYMDMLETLTEASEQAEQAISRQKGDRKRKRKGSDAEAPRERAIKGRI